MNIHLLILIKNLYFKEIYSTSCRILFFSKASPSLILPKHNAIKKYEEIIQGNNLDYKIRVKQIVDIIISKSSSSQKECILQFYATIICKKWINERYVRKSCVLLHAEPFRCLPIVPGLICYINGYCLATRKFRFIE